MTASDDGRRNTPPVRSNSPAENSEASDHEQELAKRRVACMVAFIHPFRLIEGPTSGTWNVSVENINQREWDYVELHKLVGGLDVGMTPPYHMVVARDGAVGLPILNDLRGDQEAVEFFNRCFAALLVGGVYCEAIGLDGLDFGSIIDWSYLRVDTHAPAAANQFHFRIRRKVASPFEAIHLVGARSIKIDELTTAVRDGRAILDAVPELSGELLLKGVTGIARRDWGTAVSNLWIVVEELTSNLWTKDMLAPASAGNRIRGRMDQLSDTRTWTVAARHELLHRTGVLPMGTLESLYVARKARNALAHNGKHPNEDAALAAYRSTLHLLKIASGGLPIPLEKLDLGDHSLTDPFEPREKTLVKPSHWMEIPKLPGESDLERQEAAVQAKSLKKTSKQTKD